LPPLIYFPINATNNFGSFKEALKFVDLIMPDPPDIWRRHPPDGVFLIATRTDDDSKSLAEVSPFIIKKTIDNTIQGEVTSCKKTKDGKLLILTKNLLQAEKLKNLFSLPSNTPYITIPIKITEHRSLNCTKGVIYSNDLRGIDEQIILENLRSQKVDEVEKIYKYTPGQITQKTERNETGLIKLTFKLTNLPEHIYIGYERVQVRPHIPPPMRCITCSRMGHTAKFCKNSAICSNCGLAAHENTDQGIICSNKSNCINCTEKKLPLTDHHARDRNCPVFLSHKEVQAIKTLNKVDNRTAWSIYKNRHHDGSLYSSAAKASSSQSNQMQPPKTTITPMQRKTVSYESDEFTLPNASNFDPDEPMSSGSEIQDANQDHTTKRKAKILPLNISNKTKRLLKNDQNSVMTRAKLKAISSTDTNPTPTII